MTKKDCELIAEILNNYNCPQPTDVDPQVIIAEVARAFARRLTDENPRFRRNSFLEACGVSSPTASPF